LSSAIGLAQLYEAHDLTSSKVLSASDEVQTGPATSLIKKLTIEETRGQKEERIMLQV